MSIIQSIRDYITDYTGLESAPVWVNYLGTTPVEFAIVPSPGEKIVETYITGVTVRQFPFSFQSAFSTADNLTRLENLGFYEAFAQWLEQQTADGNLPTLGVGQTPVSLLANDWGFILEQGTSETAIYQITAILTYEQSAVEPTG